MENINEIFIFLDTDSTYINYTVPYFQEGYVHYVVDAVFSLVIAIQKLIDDRCLNSSETQPICDEFYPFDGTRLLSVLRNVSFRNGKYFESDIFFFYDIFIVFLYRFIQKKC